MNDYRRVDVFTCKCGKISLQRISKQIGVYQPVLCYSCNEAYCNSYIATKEDGQLGDWDLIDKAIKIIGEKK